MVKNAVIVYEQPLNELVRVMLRLENVFEALNFHLTGDAPWQSQQACFAIMRINQEETFEFELEPIFNPQQMRQK